ncbi:bromodomain-containing protein 9 isoform X5 [Rousettus aegyptiacus]|uniref:bromodomain-containing protein 9 isoform X5 n=1 Tax=Rousettus aegyptiacus TaxID=9407 RepID=UPI00168D5CC9|nr:bromodomain-containing protein 9 isoform X5 [Rousettus aegyptiacus]
MGKKHKKHKAEWRSSYEDYADKPLEKPLKLVLKVGGSEVTELSGSGHDSSYYDDRSDHERERHREKKKKKKKKSEKEKYLDDEERRKRKEEKKRKREKEHCDTEGEADDFDPGKKVEVEPPPDRPVRACRTQPAENESTPIQQLLEHFLRQLQRKDPHGFFAFPVTDAIAPGYSMIIKHPMDFGTMKDKIVANEYKSVTEFKADFKLMCDNAMTYNRPDTVYYKLAKKILHAGFKMMSKERLLALKRSMSFMQDMDFSQQAALLGNEDTAVEDPPPEVVPVQVETAKKSKRPSREVISCMFEPEGNACSLTDSTAEEHVLALAEHAADEARDRVSRLLPGGKMGYLKKGGDGSLLYSVVNAAEPDADEEETHPVDLSSLSSKLLPGFTTLGFKDERRGKEEKCACEAPGGSEGRGLPGRWRLRAGLRVGEGILGRLPGDLRARLSGEGEEGAGPRRRPPALGRDDEALAGPARGAGGARGLPAVIQPQLPVQRLRQGPAAPGEPFSPKRRRAAGGDA